MKDNDPNKQTHAELAKGLCVSRSYVSRLSRLGMPAHSIQAARAWIKKRSKRIGTDPSSQESLTSWRQEKIRLECEILTLRLERERDDVDLVSINEVQKFISIFLAFCAVSFTAQSEAATNELVGKSELEMYGLLRQMFDRALFIGASAYFRGGGGKCDPDPRLTSFAEDCITKQFAHFPALARGEMDANVRALIKWAQEEKP